MISTETLATDGKLDGCVKEKFALLKTRVQIYILTSDTYGTVGEQCEALGVHFKILPGDRAGAAKESFVRQIGAEHTACIGNGSNDAAMLSACALSVLVMGKEGCCRRALSKADILVKDTGDAIDLLLKPERIKATLRE